MSLRMRWICQRNHRRHLATDMLTIFFSAGMNDNQVRFNEVGDGPGRYNVYQYQRIENSTRYDYVQIGEWVERCG